MPDAAPGVGDAVHALASVDDPEVGVDLVSLGLVYGIDVSEAGAYIDLTLTTPACPMGRLLCREAEAALRARGFATAEVRLVWSPLWSPSMMDSDVRRARFGARGLP